MTVIAIKDGIIAADSASCANDRTSHYTDKIFAVKPEHGGGYVASSGAWALGQTAARKFAETGEIPDAKADQFNLHLLRADGTTARCEDGCWFDIDAPFMAGGSGADFAAGAMAAGASAEEAVRLACQHMNFCGGPILTFSVVMHLAEAAE